MSTYPGYNSAPHSGRAEHDDHMAREGFVYDQSVTLSDSLFGAAFFD
jgi:hypothetical protein